MLYNGEMALSITAADGQQTTTQNPQSVPAQSIGASNSSGGVQPGTASSLLTDKQGVTLHSQALTSVSLIDNGTRTETHPASQAPVPPRHHVNAALFIIPVALCVIAVAMFWIVHSSAKSTTD